MRHSVKEFVSAAATVLPVAEPVYEFGSFQVSGQEGFSDLRPLFPGKEYVGADIRPGPGVDRILDLHDIDLPPHSAGTVLCIDTIEHVEHPRRALEEIHRILKPDGIAIITSVMNFPIHDHPFDYWRFTPEAFRSLLRPFDDAFVGFAGAACFPHTVLGVGVKGKTVEMSALMERYEEWRRRQDRMTFRRAARLMIPPLFLPFVYRFYDSVHGRIRRLSR